AAPHRPTGAHGAADGATAADRAAHRAAAPHRPTGAHGAADGATAADRAAPAHRTPGRGWRRARRGTGLRPGPRGPARGDAAIMAPAGPQTHHVLLQIPAPGPPSDGARSAGLERSVGDETDTGIVELAESGGICDGAEVPSRGVSLGRVGELELSEHPVS